MILNNNQYCSILMEAVKLNDLDIVKHILQKGVILNDANSGLLTMDDIITNRSDEMFDLVFHHYDGNRYDELLYKCISFQQANYAQKILQHMKNQNKIKIFTISTLNRMMQNLIFTNDLDLLNLFYDHVYKDHPDFKKINKVDIRFMKYEALSFLYEHDFNIKDFSELLMVSIKENLVKNIKYILDNQLVKQNINSCLKIATKHEALKSINYFLKEGADISYVLKFGSDNVVQHIKHQQLKKLNNKLQNKLIPTENLKINKKTKI